VPLRTRKGRTRASAPLARAAGSQRYLLIPLGSTDAPVLVRSSLRHCVCMMCCHTAHMLHSPHVACQHDVASQGGWAGRWFEKGRHGTQRCCASMHETELRGTVSMAPGTGLSACGVMQLD
jgi:hypothetical protein